MSLASRLSGLINPTGREIKSQGESPLSDAGRGRLFFCVASAWGVRVRRVFSLGNAGV